MSFRSKQLASKPSPNTTTNSPFAIPLTLAQSAVPRLPPMPTTRLQLSTLPSILAPTTTLDSSMPLEIQRGRTRSTMSSTLVTSSMSMLRGLMAMATQLDVLLNQMTSVELFMTTARDMQATMLIRVQWQASNPTLGFPSGMIMKSLIILGGMAWPTKTIPRLHFRSTILNMVARVLLSINAR